MDEDDLKSKKSGMRNNYLRFSGMGIQMLATIIAGVLLGKKTDEYFELNSKIFTLIFALCSVALSMYLVIKEVRKK